MTEVDSRRDPEFYFSFRTFQVEDTLFRVPRHLFLLPHANIQPISQGTDNDDDLVVLGDGIKRNDFLQFLRALYPKYYNTPEVLNTDEWQAVFKLSRIFGMDDLRLKAAENLKEMFFNGDPVEGLLCAKDNGLSDWIGPLIERVVTTNRDLTEEEVEKIGIALAMRIARAQGAATNGRPGRQQRH